MTVLERDRKPSAVKFLDLGYDLHVMTIKLCMKMEKRLTFFLAQDICKLAFECHGNLKSANSVFPSSRRDVELRLEYLTKANCNVQALYSMIDIVKGYEQIGKGKISYKEIEKWLDTAAELAKLIAGTKKADKERYKKYLV